MTTDAYTPSDHRRFTRALREGDLDRAISASTRLPLVGLRDSAKLLFLMARNKDRRYRQAAARWRSRYVAETRDLTPGMLADVTDALSKLEQGDLEAAERLLAAVAGTR
jgi:DNA-binding GntR family transcriptional regulator